MTRLAGIKAISFDVDGTLWDFNGVMRHSLAQALVELESIDADKLIAIRDTVHLQLQGVVTDLADIRHEGFKEALKEVGRPNDALAARMNNVFFKHRRQPAQLFGDVLPALERLGKRYTLGLVSNGNTYPDSLGLGGLVCFAVFAQDHGGIEKPDPRLFEIALEKASCSPQELVHVGDSLKVDVAGAKAAGVRSVWANRNGHALDGTVTPDLEVTSLRELVEAL